MSLGFDEKTAVEKCRRELWCIAAAMERCLSPGNDEDDMVLEHFMESVEHVADELDQVARGRASDLVAPPGTPTTSL